VIERVKKTTKQATGPKAGLRPPPFASTLPAAALPPAASLLAACSPKDRAACLPACLPAGVDCMRASAAGRTRNARGTAETGEINQGSGEVWASGALGLGLWGRGCTAGQAAWVSSCSCCTCTWCSGGRAARSLRHAPCIRTQRSLFSRNPSTTTAPLRSSCSDPARHAAL
jgi:hypothetical protein